MKEICIGDQCLKIKDYYCTEDHEYIPRDDGRLWLYVKMTDLCPGKCPFCVNQGERDIASEFDLSAYRQTLMKIRDHVYGVSFTGGEPMLFPELLDDAICVTREIMGPYIEIDMVTSGFHLRDILQFKHLDMLDSIHISRHRIKDSDNRRLMGEAVPSAAQIKDVVSRMDDPYRVVFNCVLQKSGISCPDHMAEYLEMAAELGVSNTSFICMIPFNAYSREQYINPEFFNLGQNPRFRIWNHFRDHQFCSCSSGDYQAKNRWVRFYYRIPGKERATYSRQFVYSADNRLFDGFGGSEIAF